MGVNLLQMIIGLFAVLMAIATAADASTADTTVFTYDIGRSARSTSGLCEPRSMESSAADDALSCSSWRPVGGRPTSMTPVVAGVVTEAGSGAESAVAGRNLGRQLASEQQVGEAGTAMSGAGTGTPLRQAARLADQYGGSASDWAKMGGSS